MLCLCVNWMPTQTHRSPALEKCQERTLQKFSRG